MVYLIGAGPGDPELLTIKGKRILEKADCVVYDRLASEELLKLIPDHAERIYVGKENHHHTMKQEDINALLVEMAGEHACVVRLKGGDPYVFGRGGEEGIFLWEHGVAFEEVPGISSAIAGLASAGIPITHRGLATGFHVITAHNRRDAMTDIDFSKLTDPAETCVFLMGLGKIREIAEGMLKAGRDAGTPAAVISCACTPQQKVAEGCLADIADKVIEAGLISPALIVVGDVVRLRRYLDETGDRNTGGEGVPEEVVSGEGKSREYASGENVFGAENSEKPRRVLAGNRYLVTKIGPDPSPLTRMLREKGASVDEVQTGEICYLQPGNLISGGLGSVARPVEERRHQDTSRREDRGVSDTGYPDNSWILFTSRHGVEGFFRERKRLKKDMRGLSHVFFGVVGEKTAACLEGYGIYPELVAEDGTGAGLISSLLNQLQDNEGTEDDLHIFYYKAEGAADLVNYKAEGAADRVNPGFNSGYHSIPIYRNQEKAVPDINWEAYEAVFFTCASSARRTLLQKENLRGIKEVKNRITIYAMGPTTGRALNQLGITEWTAPKRPSYEAMAEAEVSKWQNTPM